jgi:hypothetical protein
MPSASAPRVTASSTSIGDSSPAAPRSLALGLDDEWTALPLATRSVPSLPTEPLKRLGGSVIRTAILACEAADEERRRAPLPARAAAALPRLLRMQIGTR